MTTTRKTIRCSPISSKSDRDDARGGNAPAAGVPPARLRRYLVYIAYSRFGARTAERDDKRHRVTDCLSDYYRKFSSLTAQSSKAPPDSGGARNAHAKAHGQRVPFSLSAPFSEWIFSPGVKVSRYWKAEPRKGTLMTVIEYCREKTEVHELVIIREGGWLTCVTYIDCEDLFRLPPNIAHADVIDSSCDHIKVLDHQGTCVSVPCTCLDIK